MAAQATVLYFVIDTSGKMRGVRISMVNEFFHEIIQQIKRSGRADAYAIEIMKFSSSVRWVTNQPEAISRYQHIDIADIGGGANVRRRVQGAQ
jgi:uncharacterized protein YegL